MPEIEDIIETTETAPLLLWWQWALIGFFLALALYIILRLLKKQVSRKPEINNLKSALERLQAIQDQAHDDTELATELSILTREYLQHQFKNQSLFQTHLEFTQDHEDFKKIPESARTHVAQYLEVLSQHKYLPNSHLPTEQAKLIQQTESMLRGIDSTVVREIGA